MILLGLIILIWMKRKKSTRIAIGMILGLLSYLAWFSIGPLNESSNLALGEQRIIALLLWGVALFLLISEPRKFHNMTKGLIIKASLYNMFIAMRM